MGGTGKLRKRRNHLDAATGYLMLGMPRHAARELGHIDNPGTDRLEFLQLRAEARRDLHQYGSALDDFRKVLDEAPEAVNAWVGAGWCLKRLGRIDDAIAILREARELHTQEPILPYNLACYYALIDDKPQALSWLGRALRLNAAIGNLVADESDFDSIRDDADFRLLLEVADRGEENT